MSSSKWLTFKIWFAGFIARALPEIIKREVLFELMDRVINKNSFADIDYQLITFEQLNEELRD